MTFRKNTVIIITYTIFHLLLFQHKKLPSRGRKLRLRASDVFQDYSLIDSLINIADEILAYYHTYSHTEPITYLQLRSLGTTSSTTSRHYIL